MRRRAFVGAACLVVCLVAGLPGGLAPAAAQAPAGGARPSAIVARLGLVSQSFNLEAGGVLEMVLDLPAGTDTDPTATLVITAYRAVTTRVAVDDAIDGSLPRSVDTVDLPLALLARPAAGQVQLAVPLEADVRTAAALQLPSAGLYPVVVEVLAGGDVLAELTTFVHRLPGADEAALEELPLALAMTTQTAVQLDDETEVVVDDAVLEEYGHLADVLEATSIPLSVRLEPAHLAALATAGPQGEALAARIVAALGSPLGHELLSAPALPVDPSAAAAAGAGDRYTQWLRDGEDLLAGTTDVSSRRTVTIIDAPVSRAGAALLRDLGGRLVVLPVDIYDRLPDTFGGFTDSTQLVQLDVGDGVTIDAAVVDRESDEVFARATSTPALTAVLAVADLIAAREQIDDAGSDPRRHGLTLATPDLGLPNAATVAAVTGLLATTPGLRPTGLDDLSVRTDRLLFDGSEVVVGLPDTVEGDDLTARIAEAEALQTEAVGTSSMLPTTDDRLGAWDRLVALIPTSAVTDTQVAAIGEQLRVEFAALRAAIVLPDGFSFTLTGRRSDIPVTLQNTGDTTLTVLVRLTSPKLIFPDGPQLVELPPGEFRELRIPIEARTNGKFPVTLEVFTPSGTVRLGDPVPLTARVTALAGLGQLVTGAALLVVLTWWVRHVRQNRRRRGAGTAADRHPAARRAEDGTDDAAGDGTDATVDRGDDTHDAHDGAHDDGADQGIDDSGLSPDAATSTLPPS